MYKRQPLFGFSSPEAIAVPITALGSTGAAIGTVTKMAEVGKVSGNDIAVFTAICMCWSGYISTHIAMMDALGTKEATAVSYTHLVSFGLLPGLFVLSGLVVSSGLFGSLGFCSSA